MLIPEAFSNFIFHIFKLEKPELAMMHGMMIPMCMSRFHRTITLKLQGEGGRQNVAEVVCFFLIQRWGGKAFSGLG